MSRTAAPADPRRLDIERWCSAQGQLAGQLTWPELPRLAAAQSVLTEMGADGSADVADAAGERCGVFSWSATGQVQRPVGRKPRVQASLTVCGHLQMTCQRCLQRMTVSMSLERRFRFVESEDEAGRLDEGSDDEDVLVAARAFNLVELVEDELILALPLIPRHDTCPQELGPWLSTSEASAAPADASSPGVQVAPEASEPASSRAKPFAALAALTALKR